MQQQKTRLWNTGSFTTTLQTRMMNSFVTVTHETREESLLAAKQAVRLAAGAYLDHLHKGGWDIIDVKTGAGVLERHACRTARVQVFCLKPFRVEELAMYQ